VDAHGAPERLEGLEELERLGVVEPQVVVGKVGLERADATLAYDGEVRTVALVPLGKRHVEGVVCRAGAVGALVPLVEGVGHRDASVGRGVVHDRRGTATRGRARARLEAVGRPVDARPALHVRVRVNEAGEHPAPAGVIDLVALGRLDRAGDAHHLVCLERDVSPTQAVGAHERAALDDDHVSCSLHDQDRIR